MLSFRLRSLFIAVGFIALLVGAVAIPATPRRLIATTRLRMAGCFAERNVLAVDFSRMSPRAKRIVTQEIRHFFPVSLTVIAFNDRELHSLAIPSVQRLTLHDAPLHDTDVLHGFTNLHRVTCIHMPFDDSDFRPSNIAQLFKNTRVDRLYFVECDIRAPDTFVTELKKLGLCAKNSGGDQVSITRSMK